MTTQDTIAHYRITGKLGAGGMGEVYGTPLLSFDAWRGETAQLLGNFLPDGKHFLYTSLSRDGTDIYEGSLDGSKPVRVLNSAAVLGFRRPVHARTGYLLFYSRNRILLRPGLRMASGWPV